jgi:hypothetical protein
MGKGAAAAVGMDDAPVTTEQSVAGLTGQVCSYTIAGLISIADRIHAIDR